MGESEIQHKTIKEYLRQRLLAAGAAAVGFTKAEPVNDAARERFAAWLAEGNAGELEFLHRHTELRNDPRLLLPDVRAVVSTAWNYNPSELRKSDLPYIARYAYGRDYHKVLRKIMKPICRETEERYGCKTRICVDSAPIAERYWAVRAGVGFIGRNGCLIVPGIGSWVFLSEILLTEDVEADNPLELTCDGCGKCVLACPGGALHSDSTICVDNCVSAATIEGTTYRGKSYAGIHLLGCDACQEVCPHNKNAEASRWLRPLEGILSLSESDLTISDEEEFRSRFAGTAFMRPGPERILRNLKVGNKGQ